LIAALVGGLLSWIDRGARDAALLAICVALVAYDLLSPSVKLWQSARQIPETVLLSDLRLAAIRFGYEYGTGLRTYVTSTAPYVVGAAVILTNAGPFRSMLAGALFGFGRSLGLLQYQLKGKEGWQQAVAEQSRSLERAGAVGAVLLVVAASSSFGAG
jgi:hypothetical protein